MNPLLKSAIQAAYAAGKEIKDLYATTDFEQKEDGSPVTIADTRANEIILAHLATTTIAVLSEESMGVDLPYPDHMWVIDPLDGTRDFIEKTDDFVVMIGLLEKGRPVLGVVYAPIHDILYYAELHKGAFTIQNNITTRIQVSNRSQSGLIYVRSINHASPEMLHVSKKLHATDLPRGSVGIKAGLVSSGTGDFFFYRGLLGEWDVCAPEIITLEAGGSVSDCEGQPLCYGAVDHRLKQGALFSNSACHKTVLDVLRPHHTKA